jgi:hypothetical protein
MTRRSLMCQQSGASGYVQPLILIAVLGLGASVGVRLVQQAIDARAQCAGEEIRNLGLRAGPCRGSAKGDPSNEAQQEAQAAQASGGCGGGGSSPPAGTPTLDQALADSHVQAELQRAWNDSNPNAPEVPRGQPGSQKHEQIGWIVWNRDTGRFEVIRLPGGTRDSSNPNPRPPDNDHQTVVAWFHTHPNTDTEGYSADPSPADRNVTNSVGVPGIIETHDGRKIIRP